MNDQPSAAGDVYTIVHATPGNTSETVATGLTARQARDWLARKAADVNQPVLPQDVVHTPAGESWSAVKAE